MDSLCVATCAENKDLLERRGGEMWQLRVLLLWSDWSCALTNWPWDIVAKWLNAHNYDYGVQSRMRIPKTGIHICILMLQPNSHNDNSNHLEIIGLSCGACWLKWRYFPHSDVYFPTCYLDLCLQVPGSGDGSGLWCRLGLHSWDAPRWWLGGPSVQEAGQCMCLLFDVCVCCCVFFL